MSGLESGYHVYKLSKSSTIELCRAGLKTLLTHSTVEITKNYSFLLTSPLPMLGHKNCEKLKHKTIFTVGMTNENKF